MIYDCTVVGLGAHGSATIATLASRGLNVLGIEKFTKCHNNGAT
jgi:flavin-dependent dehydrogenase